jgi:hypothetical protein
MGTFHWNPCVSVQVPLGLGGGVTASSPVAITSYADTNAALSRVGMFGNFCIYADPTNTTTYPVAGWETGLEAWVGLWSDGGDTTLTPPGDPFDNPNPDPGWLITANPNWQSRIAVTPRHTLSAQIALPDTGLWTSVRRDTRGNPPGSFQTVYFCWVIDSQFLPLPGTSSGGVDYKVGMDFWFRALFEIP